LEVIVEFCQQHDLEERPKLALPKSKPVKKTLNRNNRPYQVGQMYKGGKLITEIASELSVKKGTVVGYLQKFIQAGHSIPSEQILEASELGKSELEKVQKAFEKHGHEILRPVFDELNEEVSYQELRVVQLYLEAMK